MSNVAAALRVRELVVIGRNGPSIATSAAQKGPWPWLDRPFVINELHVKIETQYQMSSKNQNTSLSKENTGGMTTGIVDTSAVTRYRQYPSLFFKSAFPSGPAPCLEYLNLLK